MFGGGGSVKFGPLTAQVQIQVGAFIRIMKVNGVNSTEIYGTFLAAGSASIWIFHFGATLYVSLTQKDDQMQGEATFTFSFSCGLCDYHYSVTATHNQGQLGGGGKSASLEPSSGSRARGSQLASQNIRSDASNDAEAVATTRASGSFKGKAPADVVSKAICQSEDWAKFASYFDFGLL